MNILSLVQAKNALDDQVYARFLHHYGTEIKDDEIEDLNSLISSLSATTDDKTIFNWFFVGYKIPQIGKEFDLLRFGYEYVINLELKSSSTDDKIKKQLVRNKYYLGYIDKPLHNLTYVSSTQKVYHLNDQEELDEVDISFLANLLAQQSNGHLNDIDELFNPSDYLVSPFNDTDKFLDNTYFLTNQQESIKSQILQAQAEATGYHFIAVTGSAGTGKTLLIYDVYKALLEVDKKVLLVHCGYLNEGQETLNKQGWKIISIKSIEHYNLADYDVVIIDETQRIKPQQFESIVEQIQSSNGFCLFSYDRLQTLSSSEERHDIDTKINAIEDIKRFKLSEKIRTNKEIASFIKLLFNVKRKIDFVGKDNITLNYFKKTTDAKYYLESLDSLEWEIIRFTPSLYTYEHPIRYAEPASESSHSIIGQEFDCVAVTIDEYFYYDAQGHLKYKAESYYDPVKMLFQNITRARKKLNLVIINNEEVLDRCLSILNH